MFAGKRWFILSVNRTNCTMYASKHRPPIARNTNPTFVCINLFTKLTVPSLYKNITMPNKGKRLTIWKFIIIELFSFEPQKNNP